MANVPTGRKNDAALFFFIATPISRSGDCGERRGHCAALRRLRLSLSDELTLHQERDGLALGDRTNENDG